MLKKFRIPSIFKKNHTAFNHSTRFEGYDVLLLASKASHVAERTQCVARKRGLLLFVHWFVWNINRVEKCIGTFGERSLLRQRSQISSKEKRLDKEASADKTFAEWRETTGAVEKGITDKKIAPKILNLDSSVSSRAISRSSSISLNTCDRELWPAVSCYWVVHAANDNANLNLNAPAIGLAFEYY